MSKFEATQLAFIVMLLEKILCRHCKHCDEDGIRNLEVCTKCTHYTPSKLEFKDE